MAASAWQVTSDDDGNTRWRFAEKLEELPSTPMPNSSRPSLPSCDDVLPEDLIVPDSCSDSDSDGSSASRTRFNRIQASNFSKSAITEACPAVPSDFGENDRTGEQCSNGKEFTCPDPSLQTGSSKTVNIFSISKQNDFSSPDSVFQISSSKMDTMSSTIKGGRFSSSSMFRTASSKTIEVSCSSNQNDFRTPDSALQMGSCKIDTMFSTSKGNQSSSFNSVFQTGSIEASNISSTNKRNDFSSHDSVFQMGSSKMEAISSTFKGNGFSSSSFMFQVGSGEMVNTSSTFQGNGFSCPNSMFQTGSGKMVNISSAGLLRAKALLGVHDDDDLCSFHGFGCAKKNCSGNKLFSDVEGSVVGTENSDSVTKIPLHLGMNLSGIEFDQVPVSNIGQSEMCSSAMKMPPIKFHTAGGRSISVSGEALQRARSLLGDPDVDGFSNEEDKVASMFSFIKNGNSGHSSNRQNSAETSINHYQFDRKQRTPQKFVSPLRSSFKRQRLGAKSGAIASVTNLISKFDAEACSNKSNVKPSGLKRPSYENTFVPGTAKKPSISNGMACSIGGLKWSAGVPFTQGTNSMGIDSASKKGMTSRLKRLGRSSVPPFTMPRRSKHAAPLNRNVSLAPTGTPGRVCGASYSRKRLSTGSFVQPSRPYVKEFFKMPPTQTKMEQLSECVRHMSPDNSEKYMFYDGSQFIGVEAVYHMLAQSGASTLHASKEWVANHYKWIVWKLASYARCDMAKLVKNFLTISNVFDELKYRYEREAIYGHRSAIKRILEGDASPSSVMVLCISAISSISEADTPDINVIGKSTTAKVELTDGWYSIDAKLDALLLKQLAVGKLFVGQKLRICGASLNSWSGPASPLEGSSRASLLLHINGTYRAEWADRLGFCRGTCAPLAFRCVKSHGGPIPRILVGVTRVYPVLYRERLKSGGFVVRSEKMEAAITELYNQRRSSIIEGVMSDFQKDGIGSYIEDDLDNEEGARILKMLESADEPEFIMAGMSIEKLICLSQYRSKLEARRQCDMQRVIEKALEDAGLHARDVTPYMRVRVVGLESKGRMRGRDSRDGLIRIWNPTEQQMLELTEGQAYSISGLVPLHSDSDTLHFEARGSSTKWQPLTESEKESFVQFFIPRKPVPLSRIVEVPLTSEFDTVALVVHVGLDYIVGQQKKQWVFVTDGSLCHPQTEVSKFGMLAICFSSPSTEDDTISPLNHNLVGTTVGFCNLVKRARDHGNCMWVADATENATYYLNSSHASCSHLTDAFASVKRWQQSSNWIVKKLREKVLCIVGR